MREQQKIVGIHLDLKYQMPRKTYLLEWARRLHELGINTILLEYEDKFPFRQYPFLRAQGAFTPAELRRFLDTAHGAGLKVIPLVQTLAHLEFALNHPELEHLREQRDIPTHICPSKPEAVRFVHDLIEEVLEYHSADEFFHIGADEARMLGLCPACKKRMGDKTADFYRAYVVSMCRFVMDRGKRPMLWDDAFGFGADPKTVKALPKEAIPVAWEYGCTKADPTRYPWMNLPVYRKLGYASMGAPCANYITVFPVARNVYNTALWAQQIHKYDMMGMLNTMWAGFHMPLPMNWAYIAATGELMKNPKLSITVGWEDALFREEFGARVPGLAQALRTLGEIWEVPIEGLQRPITLIGYCYMDMMLWYPRGHEDRKRCGAYPLEWHDIDFHSIYQKKLRLVRLHPEREAVIAKLRDYVVRYDGACRTVNRLSRAATRHKNEARLFADCARLKWLSARTVDFHLTGRGEAATLRPEWQSLRAALAASLAPFLEPVSVRRMLRLWCEPPMTALKEDAVKAAYRATVAALVSALTCSIPAQEPAAVPARKATAVPAPAPQSPPATVLFVSTNGTPDGDGSREHPLHIDLALSRESLAKSGTTIYLMGGRYDGPMQGNKRLPFKLGVSGAEGAPVTVMPVPGESAHLNGTVAVSGSWVRYCNLEIGDLAWDVTEKDHQNEDVVDVRGGEGVKLINCNLFGGMSGVRAWDDAVGLEVYGCLIHDFGGLKSFAAGYYAQNKLKTKLFEHNLIYRSAATGVFVYLRPRGNVEGFDIVGNISWLAGALKQDRASNFAVIGAPSADRIRLVGNLAYHARAGENWRPNVRMSNYGYSPGVNETGVVKDNYIMGGAHGLSLGLWKNLTVEGNTIWSTGILVEVNSAPAGSGVRNPEGKPDLKAYTLRKNTYVSDGQGTAFHYGASEQPKTEDLYPFDKWQALGVDQDSRVEPGEQGKPAGVKVFVFPNRCAKGRANVGIFNWDGKSAVEVDLAGVLQPGQGFRVYNCLDIRQTLAAAKPVASGIFAGGKVPLPMRRDPDSPDFEAFLVMPEE